MSEPFEFVNRGRNRRTVFVLVLIYAALLAAVVFLQAAWWIAVLLALVTLPALWDLWSDRTAGLRLDGDGLHWYAGRRRASMALHEIDHMRFDTRLDFSVRVSAVQADRRRVRLPYEALPPHKALEAAFQGRGIRVERHHFSLLG